MSSLKFKSRSLFLGLMMRSQSSEVEGVEGDGIVEGVEEVEIVEVVEEVEGVEVVFSREKSLLNSVFSTSTFMLFLFSCML